jgi:hypothetical protein
MRESQSHFMAAVGGNKKSLTIAAIFDVAPMP